MAVVRVFVQMTPGSDCDLAVSGDAISSDVSCPLVQTHQCPPAPPIGQPALRHQPLLSKNKHAILAKTSYLSHIFLKRKQ